MNVLWIEDFGDLDADENTVNLFFGDLIDKTLMDDNWDSDEDLVSNRKYISDFFSKYSQFHHIDLCRNYNEFEQFQLNNAPMSKNIDVIIIDIRLNANLEGNAYFVPEEYASFKTSDEIIVNPFYEKAGFYIYNELIQSGFPIKNMCLLTGEIGSYEDEFKEDCKKLFIKIPKEKFAFEKNGPDHTEGFKSWLLDKKESKRICLKRGILDGLDYCRNMLTDQNISYSKHLKQDSERKKENKKLYIQNYFDSIEVNINNKYFEDTEIIDSLTLLVRSITHIWDSEMRPRHSWNNKDENYINGSKNNCFVELLRQVRNTTSHSAKLEPWDEADCAIVFLISIRHILNILHTPIQPYEFKLLELIIDKNNQSNNPYSKDTVDSDKENLSSLLSKQKIYCEKYSTATNKKFPKNRFEELKKEKNETGEIKYKFTKKQYQNIEENGAYPYVQIFSCLEQLMITESDSRLLKERVYKILWHCNSKYENADNDFKQHLFSALVAKYKI